jgi:hypothetical protein
VQLLERRAALALAVLVLVHAYLIRLSLTRVRLQHLHSFLLNAVTDVFSAEAAQQGIFGVPLIQSIPYANVAISLFNEHGESYIYGYVPIVVAKCGVFLKEKGQHASSFPLPAADRFKQPMWRVSSD